MFLYILIIIILWLGIYLGIRLHDATSLNYPFLEFLSYTIITICIIGVFGTIGLLIHP